MNMSAQYGAGQVLKGIDPATLTAAERIQLAQAYATLGVAESLETLSNAVWCTETSKINRADEDEKES